MTLSVLLTKTLIIYKRGNDFGCKTSALIELAGQ